MVSRVLGLAREILTAHLFGTSKALDLFLMAFTIPNLFRRLFGEGAMHAAFIHVFTRATEASEAEARRLFRVVHSTLAATLFAVCRSFGVPSGALFQPYIDLTAGWDPSRLDGGYQETCRLQADVVLDAALRLRVEKAI